METPGNKVDTALATFGKGSFILMYVLYAVVAIPATALFMSTAIGADAIRQRFQNDKSVRKHMSTADDCE